MSMGETRVKLEQMGFKILDASRTGLLLSMRFMAPAFMSLGFKMDLATSFVGTDAAYIRFNPAFLLQMYIQSPRQLNRTYMHMIVHCLFRHMFTAREYEDPQLWDLCTDIAAESIVDSMDYSCIARPHSDLRDEWYEKLSGELKVLTAEKIYGWFISRERDYMAEDLLIREFTVDDHSFWQRMEDDRSDDGNKNPDQTAQPPENPMGGPENKNPDEKKDQQSRQSQSTQNLREVNPKDDEWKKNAERIQADLETLGKQRSEESGSLEKVLRFSSRRRTDYREFLQQFSIVREEAGVDPESFDYGFYYYGMEMYGNMPLIEENEYREVSKIDTLVIAIDTSGSCQEVLVQQFLHETATVLSNISSFFKRAKIHIIQCDEHIQSDEVITDLDALQLYADGFTVKGGFGTDFRPVFAYVDEKRRSGELKNLKGLMYFTDGCGEYPTSPTDYDTAFVFWKDEDLDDSKVPDWAIKLYLTPDRTEIRTQENRPTI